jgi:predicted nucleic acid-binding protein
MAFVVDASVTLAWYFPDEASDKTDSLRERLVAEGVHVPAHWSLEVTNALLAARHRGRIKPREMKQVLRDLRRLAEEVDPETERMAWSATVDLAEQYRLTTYDAAYLELALRKALPLATLDAALAAAAGKAGVAVLL